MGRLSSFWVWGLGCLLCATGCAPRESTLRVRTEHRTLTARTDYAASELEVRREGDRVLIRLGTTTYCRESELDRYVEIREEKGRPETGLFIAEVALLAAGAATVFSCQRNADDDCFVNNLFGIPMLMGGLIATGVDLLDFRTKRDERVLSENAKLKRKQACAFDPSAGREITLITEDGQRGQVVTNADGEASLRIPARHDIDVLVDGKPERHLAGAKPDATSSSTAPPQSPAPGSLPPLGGSAAPDEPPGSEETP
ncbi:MAG: hypothetical protein R3B07_01755 [Polyangiaceae bacterium]